MGKNGNYRNITVDVTAREMALDIIMRVVEKGAYANLTLESSLKNSQLAANDRHLVTELVNGTVRMLKHLDWVLDTFLKLPVAKQNPWLRNILRMSLYQMLYMDRVPDYACVNSAVELTRKRASPKLAGVVNGVLRNIIRNPNRVVYPSASDHPVDYMAVFYSHPFWLVKKWLEEFGTDETLRILKYNNSPVPLSIRCNQLKTSRKELILKLADDKIQAQTDDNLPWGVRINSLDTMPAASRAFLDGWFYVQDRASMLAAPILDVQPGQVVFDLCCGVGGKATLLAENMQNQGVITAVDLYQKKIDLLNYNSRRLGITIIRGIARDILEFNNDCNKKALRVLLDAPCSGLGVLNRRADSRWRKNPDEIDMLIEIQAELLQKAAGLVEKNGMLLYSTCTINYEENEGQIIKFLNAHQDFELEGFKDHISIFPLDHNDSRGAARGLLTILPGKYNTDGMFYALMRRKQ